MLHGYYRREATRWALEVGVGKSIEAEAGPIRSRMPRIRVGMKDRETPVQGRLHKLKRLRCGAWARQLGAVVALVSS